MTWFALSLLTLLAVSQTGHGEEYSLVLPKALKRHGSQDFPELLPYSKVLTAPGTVTFSHPAAEPWLPALEETSAANRPLTVSAQSGLAGTVIAATRFQAAWQDLTLAAAVRHEWQHGYTTPADEQIQTGMKRDSEYLIARVNPDRPAQIKMIAIRDNLTDAKVPHYNLDAPGLERMYLALSGEAIPLEALFNRLDLKAIWTGIEIDADNHSLRPPINTRIALDAEIRTLSLTARLTAPGGNWLTLEGSRERYDADRLAREYGPNQITAIRVPDAQADQLALEVGHKWSVTPARVEAAIRADLRRTEIAQADTRPNVPGPAGVVYNITPRELYRKYYGFAGDTDQTFQEIGARLKLEYDVAAENTLFLDLRRAIRLPELPELYYANTGTGGLLQIGNPELEAEQHHKVEIGAKLLQDGFTRYGRGGRPGSTQMTLSGFADHIQDFILLDHARGQSGTIAKDGAFIYRNVDAVLTGMTADLRYNAREWLALRLHLIGQHGRDLSDGHPLYQVPPLEANLFVDLFGSETLWNAGTRLRWVGAKRATDSSTATGTGQDWTGPMGSFVTTDLYGGYQPTKNLGLSLEIANLFDRSYREFIAEPPQTPTTTNPHAPGRTVLLRLMATF
ncbi:MAG: TonB-dependent receptor [Magnetococcales bacterium]|nr:TonB-dependent receptor [Magnetococcales bacterium]